MFINSQTFKRVTSERPERYVTTYNTTKQGQTNLYQLKQVSKEEYVKTLEDSVFYSLEVQLQNGISLQPVNTNFISADTETLGNFAEQTITNYIINELNNTENGSTSENSTVQETQL